MAERAPSTRTARRLRDVRSGSRALAQRLSLRGDDRRGRDEEGFILLESVVAISLITIVIAALAQFTMTAVTSTNELRARQAATQVATTAMAALGAVPISDLATGRDPASVNDQWNAAPTSVRSWLTTMSQLSDATAPPGSGPTAVVPTTPQTQTLNNVDYEVDTYLGTCSIRSATSTDCVIGGVGPAHVRAVVAVTWEGSGCSNPTPCTFVTATLVNRDEDPVFNTNRATPPATPSVVNPGNRVSTLGANVAVQLAVASNTGVPPLTWALTAGTLPSGLTLSASGLVSGTPSALVTSTPLTVAVVDAFGRSGSRSFSWSVVPAPTVTTPAAQTSSTSQPVNLSVARTCPNTPCSFTLANAPAGLVIDAASGVISGTPTAEGVSPGVTVTITDADGVAATTAPFSWTVLAAATISDPAPLNATLGNTKSRAIDYTCPTATCTITLAGTVPGMGLSTVSTTTGNNTTVTLTVNRGEGTIYVVGTIQATAIPAGSTSRAYAPTVRIASGSRTVTSAPGSWTVFVRPTIGAVGTRNATVGTTKSWPVTYTCANTPCTLTLTNTIPGLGLSTASGVTTTNATTSLAVSGTSGTVYLTGRVSGTAVPENQASRVYATALSISDADLAVASSSGTWTASRAPNISDPGSQAAEPNQNLALQLTADCPNGGCTWSAEAQISGQAGWFAIPISTTGRITYSNAPAGSYAVRVRVTDSDGITDEVTFPLSVQTFSLTVPSTTPATARRQTGTLDWSTRISPAAQGYTYSLTGAPSWMSINPTTGVVTASPSGTTSPGTYNNIWITVTSNASSTSTVSAAFSWRVT